MKDWSKLKPACSIVLDYLNLRDSPSPSAYIVGFGSDCIDVPHRVAELFHQGLAPKVMFCGGRGRLTGSIQGTEAAWFRKIGLQEGIPGECIIVEEESCNVKENVLNVRAVLLSLGALPQQVILVTQSVLQRRIWATWRQHIPEIRAINCPPVHTFAEGPWCEHEIVEKIRLCIDEIERLPRYGRRGDLINQEIPERVLQAARVLQAQLPASKDCSD